jgi:hypothetical protein
MADDPIDGLRESRDIDFGAFDERVREEGKFVKEHLAEGTFDNDQTALGLEHEFYAVDREGHTIRRVPRSLLILTAISP